MFELLANVYRGKNTRGKLLASEIESRHYGVAAVVDEEGAVLFSRGDIELRTYIRSSAKPFQILPLLQSGAAEAFGFSSQELAVTCASHNGEPIHVEAVASILQKTGLNESHLQCGTHPPMHLASAEKVLTSGGQYSALHNNCSGKHAGMLASCVFHHWPLDSYLEFDHPLQKKIKQYIEKYSGAQDVFCGTDGCSAPVFYLKLREIAWMFAQLGAGKDPLLTRSFQIMRSDPYMIGGSKRFDTDLITHSTVVSKVGGEGVEAVAVPAHSGGRALGVAVKIADGNFRALYPVVISILERFDVLSEEQIRHLEFYSRMPQKNHSGKEIGWIESTIDS